MTEKPSPETLRISELVDVLLAYKAEHGDLPVKFTWEGISRDVRAEWVYPSGDGWYWDDEMVLLLDAETGYYKPTFGLDESTVDEGITTE